MITKNGNSDAVSCLKHLAMLGALHENVEMGVVRFGTLIGKSPQTAARRLEQLERAGYIERVRSGGRTAVRITPLGAKRLREEYEDYRAIFTSQGDDEFVLSGVVVRGMGEGQYYTVVDGYRTQFIEKLGIDPYPGTLNIRLDEESMAGRRRMRMLEGIPIEGFTDQNRTFGSGRCYPALMEDIPCAVVEPSRTHYGEDIVEVISPVCLREELGLADGSPARVRILPKDRWEECFKRR
ncbi:DUF120 domain-containing protein [Methermicoccus shengliensis]|uniref:Riboflavin kinase n=1 Tax=Methermicoccus shengliensis TaxID=660064 RepID=A0A832RWD3_9EURY|nr:DUF120 domain-containing protein [Methermicoccus shengliensis]KUK03964.1 MAG: Riboflavin kinase [Euryarchaeota archaeon 55_53]KUK29645.1 MAG: Riboflavin kinase [Methanosarcinales archeaon 56_1174]MDI3488692.1 riboflavin kinase, archaea type [Methanosarcinales archaeon]MDN5294759.1 riboflavin kinase, archaea type [Methanosarcinales archaeon]HIH69473.1 DUF120 domain-containing protein [Methermicoccus shengliensis]